MVQAYIRTYWMGEREPGGLVVVGVAKVLAFPGVVVSTPTKVTRYISTIAKEVTIIGLAR